MLPLRAAWREGPAVSNADLSGWNSAALLLRRLRQKSSVLRLCYVCHWWYDSHVHAEWALPHTWHYFCFVLYIVSQPYGLPWMPSTLGSLLLCQKHPSLGISGRCPSFFHYCHLLKLFHIYMCVCVCMCTTVPTHTINESAHFHSMYSENMFYICSFYLKQLRLTLGTGHGLFY